MKNVKELMKLPIEERRRILREQADDAKEMYEEGGELRKFQAFKEDDFFPNP